MQLIRNILYFLLAVAMIALGAMFAVQNEAAVPLDLLVVYLPERSVALWVLLAFALGGVIGMLTSLGMVLRLRTALMAANRRIDKLARPAAAAPAAATGGTDKPGDMPTPETPELIEEQEKPA